MSNDLIWDSISKPNQGFNVRKADSGKKISAYWGRDYKDTCLFIVELDGDFKSQFKKDCIKLSGIDIDLRTSTTSNAQNVVFSLSNSVDKDIFYTLCNSLLTSLAACNTASDAYTAIFTHIRRWREFLSGARKKVLSIEEIRGLFAELEYMKYLFKIGLSNQLCVDGWTGPDKLQQDYMFDNIAVEVKSVGIKDKNTVKISSENQLFSLAERLYLIIFNMHECARHDSGYTLNQQVKSVIAALSDDAPSINIFLSKLLDYGYIELDEYDRNSFKISGSQTYEVTREFPRIIRPEIAPGIVRVSYEIEIDKLNKYECNSNIYEAIR